MDIQQMDPVPGTEYLEDRFNMRPFLPELFDLLLAPRVDHLRREIRDRIEMRTDEIEKKRGLDDAHLDHHQSFVRVKQLGNAVSQHLIDCMRGQPDKTEILFLERIQLAV